MRGYSAIVGMFWQKCRFLPDRAYPWFKGVADGARTRDHWQQGSTFLQPQPGAQVDIGDRLALGALRLGDPLAEVQTL